MLLDVKKKLPDDYKFPQIVITNIKDNMKIDAIGGYDVATNRLALSSIYDSEVKIREYVTRLKGFFANNTQYAPILHELGHKFYYELVKRVVKKHEVSYNIGTQIVDTVVKEWAESHIAKGRTLKDILSGYADKGYIRKHYTEIVAEAYSVSDTNQEAKKLISQLEGMMENDVATN